MIKEKHSYFCTTSELTMVRDSQASTPHRYDSTTYFGQSNLVKEEQTANFLEDYVSGARSVRPEDEELLLSIFAVSSFSHYKRLKRNLTEAVNKYKKIKIKMLQDEALKFKLKSTNYNFLNNKKEMRKLSSHDLLLAHTLLKNETSFNTEKLIDKIRSYAVLHIKDVTNGKIAKDEEFDLLSDKFGANFAKHYTKRENNQSNKHQQTSSALPKKISFGTKIKSLFNEKLSAFHMPKLPNINFKKFVKPLKKVSKAALVVVSTLTLGYFGHKMINPSSSESDKALPTFKIETPKQVTPEQNQNVQEKSIETGKTADFANEALNKAYKNRFDSSLEILLGQEKRDVLYAKIDKLAQNGKIEYSNGTTREWYAHAFTMYQKITPYSKETSAIKNLLNGKDIDKAYINSLVIQAKRNGTGVKGTSDYSSFDNADEALQQKHIHNRNLVKSQQKILLQNENSLGY